MPRSLLIRLLIAAVVLLGLGALVRSACTGDDSGSSDPGAEPDETLIPSPSSDPKTAASLRRPESIRRQFQPITVEEVKPFIPELAGVTPLGEPQIVAGGRRVVAFGCAARAQADVGAELENKLGELGFELVHRERPRRNLNIVAFVAQRGDLRVSTSLRETKDPDCSVDEGKNRLSLTYLKSKLARPENRPGNVPRRPRQSTPLQPPASQPNSTE